MAIQVVNKPAAQTAAANSSNMIQFIVSNLGYIFFGIIAVTLAIVIFYLIKNQSEERKERDNPLYQAYKYQVHDTKNNANLKKIRKKYSMLNLLFLGIPLIKSEQSNKVVNYSNDLIGYYRGDCFSMDGYKNFLVYKKKFLFWEDCFLLKCPYNMKVKVTKKDKKGNVLKTKYGKTILETKEVYYGDNIQELPNGDYRINCSSIQRKSFFYFPVYLENNKHIVDYRKLISEDISEMTYDNMLGNILSTGSHMVEKAMLHNPQLKFNQMSPEKTKEEDIE